MILSKKYRHVFAVTRRYPIAKGSLARKS